MKNLNVHYELILKNVVIILSFTQAFTSALFICNIPASVTRLLCVYCLTRFIAYRMGIRMSKAGPCRIRAAYSRRVCCFVPAWAGFLLILSPGRRYCMALWWYWHVPRSPKGLLSARTSGARKDWSPLPVRSHHDAAKCCQLSHFPLWH